MAAVCVQANWTASAASISSFGAAASIIASAAFTESSEIPPKGERAAACIWNNEAFTKSLDVVPRALFSRRHQCLASPSGGWTFASLPSARHILTRTGGRRRGTATAAGDLFGLCVIPLYRCWQTFGQEIAATSAHARSPHSKSRRDRLCHPRSIRIRIRSEEPDPTRWKAGVTSDRCWRIAQLFHRWLSAMWQTT